CDCAHASQTYTSHGMPLLRPHRSRPESLRSLRKRICLLSRDWIRKAGRAVARDVSPGTNRSAGPGYRTRSRRFERALNALNEGELDLLVGTQMIAKGHDVHGVTLVGVVGADAALGFPDFRAAERTFQLLTQVAGRAGRGQKPGKVILQTYFPDH